MWRSEVGRVLDGDGSPLLHSVPHLPSTSPQEGNYACFVVKGPQKVREWLESRGVCGGGEAGWLLAEPAV